MNIRIFSVVALALAADAVLGSPVAVPDVLMSIGLGGMLASSALGAGISAFGADRAADAQRDGIRDSIRLTRAQMRRANEEFGPYAEAGRDALEQFQGNTGAVPQYADTLATLMQDPGFQFEMDRGTEAIENSAAARGTLQSGNTLESLMEFGQGLASTRGGEAFSRDMNSFNTENNMLQNLMQLGFQGSGNIVTGGGAAPQLSNLMLQQGQVGANQAMNQANSLQGLLQNATFAGMVGTDSGRNFLGLQPLQ